VFNGLSHWRRKQLSHCGVRASIGLANNYAVFADRWLQFFAEKKNRKF